MLALKKQFAWGEFYKLVTTSPPISEKAKKLVLNTLKNPQQFILLSANNSDVRISLVVLIKLLDQRKLLSTILVDRLVDASWLANKLWKIVSAFPNSKDDEIKNVLDKLLNSIDKIDAILGAMEYSYKKDPKSITIANMLKIIADPNSVQWRTAAADAKVSGLSFLAQRAAAHASAAAGTVAAAADVKSDSKADAKDTTPKGSSTLPAPKSGKKP